MIEWFVNFMLNLDWIWFVNVLCTIVSIYSAFKAYGYCRKIKSAGCYDGLVQCLSIIATIKDDCIEFSKIVGKNERGCNKVVAFKDTAVKIIKSIKEYKEVMPSECGGVDRCYPTKECGKGIGRIFTEILEQSDEKVITDIWQRNRDEVLDSIDRVEECLKIERDKKLEQISKN